MNTLNGIAFTAKPKALAGPQSGIGAREADRSSSPAVAYGSAVNEDGGKRMWWHSFVYRQYRSTYS